MMFYDKKIIMKLLKSIKRNRTSSSLFPYKGKLFGTPFASFNCDRCGMPAMLTGIENVPEYMRQFIKSDDVTIPNPLGMCGECSVLLCHKCSKNGKCSICNASFLLFAECPETPPSNFEARKKWIHIFKTEYGQNPDCITWIDRFYLIKSSLIKSRKKN
jgi:hypothetical protein